MRRERHQQLALVCLALGLPFLFAVAGCGSSNNHGTSVKKVSAEALPTGSSGVGVDPSRKLAFVGLDALDGSTGNGIVAVVNIGANPGTKNPKIIDLGHPDYPIGVAVDPNHNRVYVVSGDNGNGGFLDIINESTKKVLTSIPFPTGSDTGSLGELVYNPSNNTAVVSTVDGPGCPSSDACTGFTIFDIASKTFGPVIQSGDSMGSDGGFAVNPQTGALVTPDDDIDPTLLAVDLPNSAACTLSDSVLNTISDADGASFDQTTNIVVIGAYSDHKTAIVNLNGSTFSGMTPPCTLDEAGTPPNSVSLDLGADDPGVAVNPSTHQAFLTGESTTDVALVSLPASAVTQIDTSMISGVTSTLPNTPDGSSFDSTAFPYYTTVDVVHNTGYIVNDSFTWLAQVDLAQFQSNPAGISTPLPSGSCAGTSYSCDNGAGVKYYPLTIP